MVLHLHQHTRIPHRLIRTAAQQEQRVGKPQRMIAPRRMETEIH